MSFTGEMEPAIIEYARFHCVATDHLAIDPRNYLPRRDSSDRVAFPDDADEILQFKKIQLLLTDKESEKLDIFKHGARLLSSTIKDLSLREDASCQHDLDAILPDYGFIRRMKVEEPMLREEHELDMCAFRAQTSFDGIDLDLPLELIDDERDEGLAFPSYCQELPSQIQERVAKEKLDCTRESLQFMENIRNPLAGPVEDAHKLAYADMVYHKKQQRAQSITPPLLPRDPTPAHYIPPEPSLELDCAPQEQLTLPELNQMEQILTEDFKLAHTSTECMPGLATGDLEDGKTLVADDANLFENGKFVSPKRPLLVDLKVDGPITPPQSTKKRCIQKDRTPPCKALQTVARPSLPDTEPDSDCAAILDDNLATDAMSAAKEVENKLDAEHPRTVGSSVRANVPCLVGFKGIPPWSNRIESPSKVPESSRLVTTLLQDHISGFKPEELAKYESNLQWNPFPMGISEADTRESIDDHSILAELLVKPRLEQEIGEDEFFQLLPTFRLASLTSERDNDEDDLISPRSSGQQADGDTVNELHNDGSPSSESSPFKESAIVTDPKQAQSTEAAMTRITDQTRAPEKARASMSSSLFSSQFSASKQLANFMDIRGQKSNRIEVGECPYFKPSSPSEHVSNDETGIVTAESGSQSSKLDSTNHIKHPFPVPIIPGPMSQTVLVISFSLLHSHRRVVRILEALSPPAKLVFRDSTPAKSGQIGSIRDGNSSTSPASSVEQKVPDRTLQEADIVLSPTTSILLTTSQETTQLYLPGHRPTNLGTSQGSPLRDRICNICPRYECLYVLICHSAFQTSGNLAMDDKTAGSVRTLISFCFSLSPYCRVRPLLVASSPENLTQWIISLSNKHHFSRPSWVDPDKPLLTPEDPTTWELFLRRVGLNPYAAQFVLSSLHHHPQNAIRHFVAMDPHKRIHMFAPILGERVVTRVNKLLEIVW